MAETDSDKPIDPATRQRLQKMFEFGAKALAGNQFDYAVDMFAKCVADDPGNVIYTQNLLGALARKYNNNKKGGSFTAIKGAGTKAAMMKCHRGKDWSGVIRHGVEFLKLNPWDSGCLSSMAEACGELEHNSCQIAYLKNALDADIKDLEINRKLARALDADGQYDGAIVCWQRILAAKPTDEEAQKGRNDAQVRNTMKKGRYEEAQDTQAVRADKVGQDTDGPRRTPEQELQRAIAKKPDEVSNYIELAEFYMRDDLFDKAEEVLTTALQISGNDFNVRERMEDCRVRKLRQAVAIAEEQYAKDRTEAHLELLKKYKVELNVVELEVYRLRCDRYPTNQNFRYELGIRLRRAGKFPEAIRCLQEARNDPQHRGEVLLALGECFQEIKQYRLSMDNYVAAIDEIPERNTDGKKLALYRAGKLGLGMKDYDTADKHLHALAAMDYAYRDLPELLEKLRRAREGEEA